MMRRRGVSYRSIRLMRQPALSTGRFSESICLTQYTDVAVYKGYVETENKVGKTRINAGQMVSLGQNTNGELAPMGPSDEWETWNKTRNDRIFARRGSSSTLSSRRTQCVFL